MPEPPRIDVEISASDPFAAGIQVGRQLRAKIRCALDTLNTLEAFQMQRPWWLPQSLFQVVAGRKAHATLHPAASRIYPHLVDRMRGMAEGAAVSLQSLYLFHAMETMQNPVEGDAVELTDREPFAGDQTGWADRTGDAGRSRDRRNGKATQPVPPLAGCSAVGIGSQNSSSGQSMIAHNFDMLPASADYLVLRRCGQGGRLRSLQFSYAPLAGTIDGINEAGLAVTYNFVGVTDADNSTPPLSFAIDETLSRAETVDQAVAMFGELPRGSGGLLMIADASGAAASLQMSGGKHHLIRSDSWGVPLCHTNDFTSREMADVEIPRSAVFGSRCPDALQGVSVYRSSVKRRQTLRKRLATRKHWDADALSRLMATHHPSLDGREETCENGSFSSIGDADTVCMHGDYWSTIASVQLFPAQRRLRIAYGPPCRSEATDWIVTGA